MFEIVRSKIIFNKAVFDFTWDFHRMSGTVGNSLVGLSGASITSLGSASPSR